MNSYFLYFAWLIACVSTIGSLYFSEALHMEPCHLCWYQRICIFPLAIILSVAVYNNFLGIAPYALPLVFLGFLFSIYQIIIQETGMSPIEMCGAGPSCTEKVYIGLGFITIPMLSALALFMMGVLILLAYCCSPMRQNNSCGL